MVLEKIENVYSKAMSVDNTHVSKVAGFILIALGLYFIFEAEGISDSKRKDKMNILGWVTVVVGACYMLFTVFSSITLLRS